MTGVVVGDQLVRLRRAGGERLLRRRAVERRGHGSGRHLPHLAQRAEHRAERRRHVGGRLQLVVGDLEPRVGDVERLHRIEVEGVGAHRHVARSAAHVALRLGVGEELDEVPRGGRLGVALAVDDPQRRAADERPGRPSGPGIGPTPMSSAVMLGMSPPSSDAAARRRARPRSRWSSPPALVASASFSRLSSRWRCRRR